MARLVRVSLRLVADVRALGLVLVGGVAQGERLERDRQEEERDRADDERSMRRA